MTQGYISDNVEWFKKEIIDIAKKAVKIECDCVITKVLILTLFDEAKEKCTIDELEACSNFCKQYAEEPRYFAHKNSIDLSSCESYEAFSNVFKNMQIALYNFTNSKIKLEDDLPNQEEIRDWFMIELNESLRVILEEWKILKQVATATTKCLFIEQIKHDAFSFFKKVMKKHHDVLCLTLFIKILEVRLTRNPIALKGSELDIRNTFFINIKNRFEGVIEKYKKKDANREIYIMKPTFIRIIEDIYKPSDRVCFVAHRQAAYLYPQVPEQASQFNDNFYLGIVEDCSPNRMGEKTCKLKNAFYIVGSDIIDMLTRLISRHVDEIIGSKDFNEKQFMPVKQKDPVRENHDGLTTLYGKILLKTIDEKHFPKLNKMLCVYAEELQACDENDCDGGS